MMALRRPISFEPGEETHTKYRRRCQEEIWIFVGREITAEKSIQTDLGVREINRWTSQSASVGANYMWYETLCYSKVILKYYAVTSPHAHI